MRKGEKLGGEADGQRFPNAESKPAKVPRNVQNARAWAGWRDAAQRFNGIGQQLEARTHLRHIRLSLCGYQVVFDNKDGYLSRCFAGFDEASLQRAIRFRDQAERQRGESRTRVHRVPPEVLAALGLSEEVPGISRLPSRSVYRIDYTGQDGRRRLKQFYFRRVPEVDAYAAAIEFLRDREAARRS